MGKDNKGMHRNGGGEGDEGGEKMSSRQWSPDERRDEQKELLRSLILDSAARSKKSREELNRLTWNLGSRGEDYEKVLQNLILQRESRNGCSGG